MSGLPAGISTSCEGYIGLSIIQFSHPKMLWNVVDCSISSSIQYDMDFRGEANTRSKSRQCFLEFQLERVCINSMPFVPKFNVSHGVAYLHHLFDCDVTKRDIIVNSKHYFEKFLLNIVAY